MRNYLQKIWKTQKVKTYPKLLHFYLSWWVSRAKVNSSDKSCTLTNCRWQFCSFLDQLRSQQVSQFYISTPSDPCKPVYLFRAWKPIEMKLLIKWTAAIGKTSVTMGFEGEKKHWANIIFLPSDAHLYCKQLSINSVTMTSRWLFSGVRLPPTSFLLS